jgi:hypothetical protein
MKRFALLLLATSSCGSCGERLMNPDAEPPPPPRDPGQAVPPDVNAAKLRGYIDPPPSKLCRAIAGEQTGKDLPDAWIEIKSTVTLKHPQSGREITVRGPAQIRACVNGEEELWIDGGIFEASPRTGESPGAEQWVITGGGVVRYGVAALKITGGKVQVASGSALVLGGKGDAGPDAWTRVEANGSAELTAKGPPEAVVARCEALAEAAAALAGKIASADASLSDLAPRHVEARQLARAACAVAGVRARGTPLEARAAAAGAKWRALP